MNLPVCEYREKFLEMFKKNQCMVLTSETGSGKTTKIPTWCVDFICRRSSELGCKRKIVCCTQPRRIAAMGAAARVAEEMRVEVLHQKIFAVIELMRLITLLEHYYKIA